MNDITEEQKKAPETLDANEYKEAQTVPTKIDCGGFEGLDLKKLASLVEGNEKDGKSVSPYSYAIQPKLKNNGTRKEPVWAIETKEDKKDGTVAVTANVPYEVKNNAKDVSDLPEKEKKALEKIIGLCLKRGIKEAGIERVMKI